MSPLRIGTRSSRLARAQTDWVEARLREAATDVEIEVVEIRTFGDLHPDRPLRAEHGTAFFTKEIEDALLDRRIDLAVHSCKDLATRLPDGLALASVPERLSPNDVLVSRGDSLRELPAGATVGTSSIRRREFLAHVRPDLVCVPLRGNVPTRLRAVDEGRVDGVILAAAGLARLGLADRTTDVLDVGDFPPPAGQGALALEVRADDDRARRLAALLEDVDARRGVDAERSCLCRLEAGCQAPVGVLARATDREIGLDAAIAAPSGIVRRHGSGSFEDPEALGLRVALELLEALGISSLSEADWSGPSSVGASP